MCSTLYRFRDHSCFDVVKDEGSDALPLLSHYKLDFSKLMKNLSDTNMLTTIHQHYLMQSPPHTLGKDEATYVEYGFVRFVDAETMKAAVDEATYVEYGFVRFIDAETTKSFR
ncbi:hypothetical protein BYT27DRAFT_6539052 [Phlegmacium glaucopus]|nr:hypothetical protein BYT27DRAFT_6539052 [Phlegmacium glaucopus]